MVLLYNVASHERLKIIFWESNTPLTGEIDSRKNDTQIIFIILILITMIEIEGAKCP